MRPQYGKRNPTTSIFHSDNRNELLDASWVLVTLPIRLLALPVIAPYIIYKSFKDNK